MRGQHQQHFANLPWFEIITEKVEEVAVGTTTLVAACLLIQRTETLAAFR
jgi:hypothetical protein